jgi:tetratricopeptide (TPR) repeat protein
MARLEIKDSTLKKLFALTGNRCAFPECTQAVVNEHGDLIAEVCHIEAANEGGPRWNPDQSDEDRRSFENLLILCPTHHAVTDNEAVYPVGRMKRMKREHEQRSAAQPLALDDAWAARLIEQVARQMSREIRPIALPYSSIGRLFKGRGEFLSGLRASLCGAAEGHATAIVGKAVHGLGGVGKSRLAIEYAWQHAADYSALLFVTADSPESLARNLAGLCGPAVLDLPEQHLPEEEPQRLAVLRWLREHPGWLLILDNVDTREAARAAEELLAQLHGGHVLLTGRLSSWSARVEPLELDVLGEDDAVEFLLARTDAGRRKTADEAADARRLAIELGQLALALEQAGAYIVHHRLTFAGYLDQWRDRHDRVLEWFDERLMQYPRSLAMTWQTSVDQLSETARRLLQHLAWFAPDPIPESLLEVPVPGVPNQEPGSDGLLDALTELDTYSLVTRSRQSPSFSVHRLVQDVTRRSLRDGREHSELSDALRRVNVAFEGDPADVRTWPTLDPLAPHARAAAGYADQAGIAEPTSRLMSNLANLLFTKALHAEAEPLMRRALAIDEQSFGNDHPNVARDLNNLAQLLQATNRLIEAEPLMRRALEVSVAGLGREHPITQIVQHNHAGLLEALVQTPAED